MTRTARTKISAALIPLGLAACQAPTVQATTDAEQIYHDTCVLCHATSGPNTMFPDLTTLSAFNGGVFPMDRVIEIIDGRNGVRAHGSPMPVWGDRMSPQVVQDLAVYLASIQQ